MNWTAEQKQVIDLRGKDLLVSAAAGSGKTAVLVEHIISRVTDEQEPLSLDRLLVMTFTRAAAEEMRERIGRALSERIQKDPENRRLRLQKAILPRAKIATIDSICQNLIRQHYEALDIDPGFRAPDEGELKMMRGDLLKDLLEEAYEAQEPAFLHFVEAYGGNRLSERLSELIERTWVFIEADPWPMRYLEAQQAELSREAEGAFEQSAWYRQMLLELDSFREEYEELLSEAAELCGEEDGPAPYLSCVESLLEAFETLAACRHYGELYDFLQTFSTERLKVVRGAKYDPDKKARVKTVIDSARSYFAKLKESYTVLPEEKLRETIRGSAGDLGELVRLTAEFTRRFDAKKREKNYVDFGDMEHLALQLLYQEKDGEMVPSPLADELSGRFDEILIDEYQDSNGLQEALVAALSGGRFGRHDIFMVGDVKQSIYRFRLAKPELFMEKYHTYDSLKTAQKIELNRNFRSRVSVLASINDVFGRIMRESLGGVEYDDAAALYAGAAYPESGIGKTELVILETKSREDDAAQTAESSAENGKDSGKGEGKEGGEKQAKKTQPSALSDAEAGMHPAELAELSAAEYEAKYIAQRIKELVSPEAPEKAQRILDKETGKLRSVRYGDIVILMRAPGSRAEKMTDILGLAGIPAVSERATGYFSAAEVEAVLACLNVIDNPHQDIALAACMRSPIGGFSDAELSQLRASFDATAKEYDLPLTDLCEALHYGAYGALYLAQYAAAEEAGMISGGSAGDGTEGEAAAAEEDRSREDGRASEEGADRKTQTKTGRGCGEAGAAELPELSEQLQQKCRLFLSWLSEMRQCADVMPVHALLHRIYTQTGYYDYVCALPLGKLRAKNLDMLLGKAEDYAAASYHGLFHFVRYIEQLKSYDTDYGEAKAAAGEEDFVRILSIHKSKGLEYPIVFLANAGKRFNRTDTREPIVVDMQLGLAADYVDTALRVRFPGLKKAVIARRMQEENLGEELRILYVAMTRAKEKLIIVASAADPEAKIEKLGGMAALCAEEKLPKSILLQANSYLDLFLMSGAAERGSMLLCCRNRADVADTAVRDEADEADALALLRRLGTEQSFDSAYARRLREQLGSVYRHEAETKLKPKVTVSELKHAAMHMPGEADYDDDAFAESLRMLELSEEAGGLADSALPQESFIPAQGSLIGAGAAAQPVQNTQNGETSLTRHGASKKEQSAFAGTAYHRVMELLAFEAWNVPENGTSGQTDMERRAAECGYSADSNLFAQASAFAEQELLRMRTDGRLPERGAVLVRMRDVAQFLCTPLAAEMADAARRGELRREQRFMAGIPARELSADTDSEELQLLQGIIDAWMITEDGGICLIDYKTDHVRTAEELRERYAVQLALYARALEQITGRTVEKQLIYSTALGETISV